MSMRGVAIVGVLGCVLFTACSSGGNSDPALPSSSSPASSGSSTATSNTTSRPAVAEAGGWRLALTAPQAGSAVGRPLRLCYELAGASREPDAELDVRVLVGSRSETMTVPAAVGRGSAIVASLRATGAGSITVQLRAEGLEIPGVRIEVPVRFVDAGDTGACP